MENERHETPTRASLPADVILICVRCDEEWTFPHNCDAINGKTKVRVIHL